MIDSTSALPGDPDEVDRLAARLRGFATRAGQAGRSLAGLDSAHWSGRAAEQFRNAVGEVPSRLSSGGDAFDAAARELTAYAAALRDAQRQVASADRMRTDAEQASQGWRSSGQVGADPGQPLRQQAERLTTRAVDEAKRAADAATRHIAALTADAPSGRADVGAGGGVQHAGHRITAVTEHELNRPDDYVAPLDHVVSDVRFGEDHAVAFGGGHESSDWNQWQQGGDGRSTGTVGTEALAAAGLVAFRARRRRPRTALETAGEDVDSLRERRGSFARRHRDGVATPARSGAWRTNVTGHARTSGAFRVWAGPEGNPLARTRSTEAVTLAPVGSQAAGAPGVVTHSGPPASERR